MTIPVLEAAMASKFFKNAAGDFVTAFCRLVGIGRRAERDGFARLHPPQFASQQICCVLLDINFLFKLKAVAHLHELVGVSGIAILAGESSQPR